MARPWAYQPQSAADSSWSFTPAPPKTHSEWYGWQTLLCDVGTIGVGIALASADSSGGAAPGAVVTSYLFCAPIVHGVHGRPGAAGGSLALRLALPLVIGGIAGSTKPAPPSSDYEDERLAPTLYGALAGVIAAVVLDAAALSHEQVADSPPAVSFAASPMWDPRRRTVGASLRGTF